MSKPKRQWLFAAGNLIEWYDFCLFGYYASILSDVFYPKNNHVLALLAVFITYAIGFFIRPIGGLVIGYLGERISIKFALMLSLVCMSLPTAIMGLLPTYQTIGLLAPVLLLLVRCIQGFSVGGQYITAIINVVERSQPGEKALNVGKVYSGSIYGYIFASVVGYLLYLLPIPTYVQWRLPFIMSAAFLPIIYLFGKHLAELETKPTPHQPITVSGLSKYWVPIVKVCLLSGVGSAIYFSFFVYMITYIKEYVPHLQMRDALMLNFIGIIFSLPFIRHISKAADTSGLRNMAFISLLGLLLVWPLMHLINAKVIWLSVLVVCFFGLIVPCYNVPVNCLCAQQLRQVYKYSGTAFGYNLGAAVLGGTTPAVLTLMNRFMAPINALSLFLFITFVVGVCVLLWVDEPVVLPTESVSQH